jgi:hypothetical protein
MFKKIKGIINPNKKNKSDIDTTKISVDEKPITISKEIEVETPILSETNKSETNKSEELVTINEQLDKSNLNKE